jgi:hypothetical protein
MATDNNQVEVLRRGGVTKFESMKTVHAGIQAAAANSSNTPKQTRTEILRKNAECSHKQAQIAVDEQNALRNKLTAQTAINERMLDFVLTLRTKLASNPAHASLLKEIDTEIGKARSRA